MVSRLNHLPLTIIDMNIGSDEKKHIARFLGFLLSGEKIAHRCSARQARLCDDVTMKRFLLKQSRQEKFHAITFQSAILWLAPKGVSKPAEKQMQQYESILTAATDNNDLFNSIVGLQVILEGMGDITLSHLDTGIRQRSIGYQKIRRAILAQEDSHHEFGVSYLKTNITPTSGSSNVANYLSLINEMLDSVQGLFDYFDEDVNQYKDEFNDILPGWIHENALGHYSNA